MSKVGPCDHSVWMWSLWMIQNKRRYGDQTWSLHQTVIWARDTAYDLWTLAHSVCRRNNDQELQRWKPPRQGWIKINVDASFDDVAGSGAAAGVCRDDQGNFLMAQRCWYDRILDAGMMEALACRNAMQEAARNGMQKDSLGYRSLEACTALGQIGL